jgi:hypothetical protein
MVSKKLFWQRANDDALSVYDAVYSALSHLEHDVAHNIAMAAYQATIAQKNTEYQAMVAVKRFSRREKVVLEKFRAPEPKFSFWQWLTTSSKTMSKTSSVKLAAECQS